MQNGLSDVIARGAVLVHTMQPFKVLYANFDGGDNTAFIPMAKTRDDENTWLCCFPEATSDEGEGLIDVKTHKIQHRCSMWHKYRASGGIHEQ